MNCIFCKIIKNEVTVKKLWEDKNFIAIFDIKPVAPIHILIFPKVHIEEFNTLDENKIKSLFKCVLNLVEIFKLKKSGYRFLINQGKNSGQEIKHIHFHLIGGRKLKAIG